MSQIKETYKIAESRVRGFEGKIAKLNKRAEKLGLTKIEITWVSEEREEFGEEGNKKVFVYKLAQISRCTVVEKLVEVSS